MLVGTLFTAFVGMAQTLCTTTEVRTEISILASAEQVWNLLLNTKEYTKWHPYITAVDGEVTCGKKIKVYTIDSQKQEGKFKAYILTLEPKKELAWGGSLGFIFRARHYFIIESIGNDVVHFVQGEYWKGWLGKWYGKKIYQKTFEGFNKMNQNMKLVLEPIIES
jgi:hypothetical protein